MTATLSLIVSAVSVVLLVVLLFLVRRRMRRLDESLDRFETYATNEQKRLEAILHREPKTPVLYG